MAAIAWNKKAAIFIWLVIGLMATVIKGNGQATVNLQKTVVIPANTMQLDSLLHLINRQAGIKFSINTRKIPPSRSIPLKKQKQTIAGVLQQIKQATGVYYAVLGDHIILLDNPPKRAVPQNKKPTVKKAVVKKNNPPPSKSQPSALVRVQPPVITVDHPINSDTIKAPPVVTQKPDILPTKPPVRKPSVAVNNQPATTNRNSSEERSFAGNLLVKGAMQGDDVFYFGAVLQAGKPWLYAIASWNTNFKLSGFRYGAGTSITLSDEWKLHLQLTTGHLTSNFDTANQRWQFKTQLHRAAIVGEVKFMQSFTVQFGPVFNLMKLTYSVNDVKKAPGLSQPQVDQKFTLIKPIYTLSNNYSLNAAQSNKVWLGLQVGIYYNFINPR